MNKLSRCSQLKPILILDFLAQQRKTKQVGADEPIFHDVPFVTCFESQARGRGLNARFATGEYSALFEIFLNHLPLSLPHYNYLRVA